MRLYEHIPDTVACRESSVNDGQPITICDEHGYCLLTISEAIDPGNGFDEITLARELVRRWNMAESGEK